MKKVMMLLVLCGVAQVQALTVKNNSNSAIKVTVSGGDSSPATGFARTGETARIALNPGTPTTVTVQGLYDVSSANLDCNSNTTMTIDGQEKQVHIECFGSCGWGGQDCFRGVVGEELAKFSVPKNPGLRDRHNFTFNGRGSLTKDNN